MPASRARLWWTRGSVLLLIALAFTLPLIGVRYAPLNDLMGHMARYHIQLTLDSSPTLGQWYGFEWQVIGNLGADLLIVPLAKLFGLETGVKLIAMAAPPLTVAGMLWIAREAHGRIPPTALFALPLAFGYPYQFGFINYVLAAALALNAFALWLMLDRLGRRRLRALLFLPIGLIVWTTHAYGWGLLGLLCLSAELHTARHTTGRWPARLWRAGVALLPLTLPLGAMILWRGGAGAGDTGNWFSFALKGFFLSSALRDWNELFDRASLVPLMLLIGLGIARRGLRIEPMLGLAALLLLATYLLMPYVLMGSAYADMRLAPYLLAIAILSLRPAREDGRAVKVIAIAGLLFCAVRIGVTTEHYRRLDDGYATQLAALHHVPRGARVFVLATVPCRATWSGERFDHLGGQVIVQRDGFANGLWTLAGAQGLTVHHAAAGRFAGDPTQLLRPPSCRGGGEPILDQSITSFPRDAFDYVWLIGAPRTLRPRDARGLTAIWEGPGGKGILYRIDRATPRG